MKNITLGIVLSLFLVSPVLAFSVTPVPPATEVSEVPTTPVPVPVPPPVAEVKSQDGGGALQFIAQAWDSKILTWQYKVVPCGYFGGCVDITKTEMWAKLKAEFPQIYK